MAEGTKVGGIYYDLSLDDSGFLKATKRANQEIDGMRGSFAKAEAGSMAFAAGLGALTVAIGGAIGFGVKYAADLETMEQGFVTLLGSTKKASEAIEMIKKDAAKTPFTVPGLINANQLLTSVTKDAQKSERLLLNVGKALAAMGKGQPELDRIIVNLQQIGAVGKASMIDVKQFAFAGIPIFDMLKEHIKGTGENLDDFISDGKVTFELLTKLFQQAGEGSGKFANAFRDQSGTFNQTLSNLQDNIGMTMSSLVEGLGIFGQIKIGLKMLSDSIGNLAKPESIEKLNEELRKLAAYAPTIIGLILGGLVPAFGALAMHILLVYGPLVPFMVAGAALGFIVQKLIEHFGGLNNVMAQLAPLFSFIGEIFQGMILPLLQELWRQIQEQLLPALQNLWNILSPVLIPVLQLLGAMLGTILLASILLFIGAIMMIVLAIGGLADIISMKTMEIYVFFQWLFDTVLAGLFDFINSLGAHFQSIPGIIKGALSGVYGIIKGAFEGAFNWLNEKLNGIKNALKDALDLTKRHSPSVVDIVKNGVGLVNKEFDMLSNVTLPSVSDMLTDGLNGNTTTNNNTPININIARVGSQGDVAAIGRELGFRINTA